MRRMPARYKFAIAAALLAAFVAGFMLAYHSGPVGCELAASYLARPDGKRISLWECPE
jgi:hypothetical protein